MARSIRMIVWFLCVLFPGVAFGANTYSWRPVPPGGSWTSASSWTPSRVSPAPDDILVFPPVANLLITGVPTQTVGQLIFQPGAGYDFGAGSAGTLTIAGGSGLDFDLPANSYLRVISSTALAISLAAGATGRIGGEVDVNSAAHRLLATDVGALTVANGGKVLTQGTFSGNLFGTTSLNSVVFENGSLYQHGAGANPFGAPQPNSVVVFQPGSLFRLVAALTPAMSGRTYANFEYDTPANLTALGTSPLSIDSITVKQGSFSIALGAPVSIRGSLWIGNSASLRLGPLFGTATYTFNGTVTQNVDLEHNEYKYDTSFDGRAGTTLAIDNPAGVRFTNRQPALSCYLQFVHGHTINPSPIENFMRLFGNGEIIGASQSTGWVEGRLNAPIRPDYATRTYPVGNAQTFTPVSLFYHGLTVDSMDVDVFSAVTRPGDYPYCTMAQIDSTKKVNLVWRVGENLLGSGLYSSFDVAPGWGEGDMDLGALPGNFVLRTRNYGPGADFYIAPYQDVPVADRTAISLLGTGVTRRGADKSSYFFNVGEPATVQITAEPAAASEGAPSAPGPTVASGAALTFPVSILPASVSTVHVDYSVVDGTATASSDDYTPVSGTLTFAPGDTVEYVTVPITGDSSPERNETVQLELANPSGAEIAVGTSTGTVLDDDDVTPPSVAVISPNGGETVHVGSPVDLKWNATDDVAVSAVDLEISRDGGSTYEPVASGVPNTGTYSWTPAGPTSASMILRVTARDDPGHTASDVSDAEWALGSEVAVEAGTPTAFALSPVVPNPARGALVIGYALPRRATVRLDVVDVRGRIVRTLMLGEQPAGEGRIAWRSGDFAPGLYFVRLHAPGFEAARRFIVLR